MDPGSLPLSILLQETSSILNPDFSFTIGFFIECISLLALLLVSGFISGAETAFFAITPAQLFDLKENGVGRAKVVYNLIERPKRLLATLLITINFVNIAIVVVSSLIIEELFRFTHAELIGFLIQVVAVTFVIVLFCEVMPKVYATHNAMRSSARWTTFWTSLRAYPAMW